MPIPLTGPISASMIRAEFGGPLPFHLSNYYRGGTYVHDSPANSHIPTSGQIKFSDFRGAAAGPAPNDLINIFWSNRATLVKYHDSIWPGDTTVKNDNYGRFSTTSSTTFNFSTSGITGDVGSNTTIVVWVPAQHATITSVTATGAGIGGLITYSTQAYYTTTSAWPIAVNVYHFSGKVTGLVSVTVNWNHDRGNQGAWPIAFAMPGLWNNSSGDTVMAHNRAGAPISSGGTTLTPYMYDSPFPASSLSMFLYAGVQPDNGSQLQDAKYNSGGSTTGPIGQQLNWAMYWYTHANFQLAANVANANATLTHQVGQQVSGAAYQDLFPHDQRTSANGSVWITNFTCVGS